MVVKKPRLHSRRMYTHVLTPKTRQKQQTEAMTTQCVPQPTSSASSSPACSTVRFHARLPQRLPQLRTTHNRGGHSQLGSGRASEQNKGVHYWWSQGAQSGVIWSSDWCWGHPCTHPVRVKPPLWSSCPTGQLSTRAKAAIAEERAQVWRPGQAQA